METFTVRSPNNYTDRTERFVSRLTYPEGGIDELYLDRVQIPHSFCSVPNSYFLFQEGKAYSQVLIPEDDYTPESICEKLEELFNLSSPNRRKYTVSFDTSTRRITIQAPKAFRLLHPDDHLPSIYTRLGLEKVALSTDIPTPDEKPRRKYVSEPLPIDALKETHLRVRVQGTVRESQDPTDQDNWWTVPILSQYGDKNINDSFLERRGLKYMIWEEGRPKLMVVEIRRGDGSPLDLHCEPVQLTFSCTLNNSSYCTLL